jgi:hypothetical protein
LLAVQTVQAYPLENGQTGQSSQGNIAHVNISNAYTSRMFAGEATFFHLCDAAELGEEEIFSNFHAHVFLAMPLMRPPTRPTPNT